MAHPYYYAGKTRAQVLNDYQAYIVKFDRPLTTDDTFTPPEVYDALIEWATHHHLITPDTPIVRPFFPGADYTQATYPQGSIVIDNPPFSILSQIIRYYQAHHITYLLFAPSLTSLGTLRYAPHTVIITNTSIRYANGATISTAFLTNHPHLSDNAVITAPDLHHLIKTAQERAAQQSKATLPRYAYPDHLVTAARLHRIAPYIPLAIPRAESHHITTLQSQRPHHKSIYGSGLLISDRLAQFLQAAQLQAATPTITYPLTPTEQKIIQQLSHKATKKLV